MSVGLSAMTFAGNDLPDLSASTASSQRVMASKAPWLSWTGSPMIGAGPCHMIWLACVPCTRSSRARSANARKLSCARPGSFGPARLMIGTRSRLSPSLTKPVRYAFPSAGSSATRRSGRGLRWGSRPPICEFRSTTWSVEITPLSSALKPYWTPTLPSGTPAKPRPAFFSSAVQTLAPRGASRVICQSRAPQRTPAGFFWALYARSPIADGQPVGSASPKYEYALNAQFHEIGRFNVPSPATSAAWAVVQPRDGSDSWTIVPSGTGPTVGSVPEPEVGTPQ